MPIILFSGIILTRFRDKLETMARATLILITHFPLTHIEQRICLMHAYVGIISANKGLWERRMESLPTLSLYKVSLRYCLLSLALSWHQSEKEV